MNTPVASRPHPFAELVGFEVTARGEGRCTSEISAEERHLNPNGVVHGAVLYALADTGMGGALTSMLDAGQLFDEEDRLLARATGTFVILDSESR